MYCTFLLELSGTCVPNREINNDLNRIYTYLNYVYIGLNPIYTDIAFQIRNIIRDSAKIKLK